MALKKYSYSKVHQVSWVHCGTQTKSGGFCKNEEDREGRKGCK